METIYKLQDTIEEKSLGAITRWRWRYQDHFDIKSRLAILSYYGGVAFAYRGTLVVEVVDSDGRGLDIPVAAEQSSVHSPRNSCLVHCALQYEPYCTFTSTPARQSGCVDNSHIRIHSLPLKTQHTHTSTRPKETTHTSKCSRMTMPPTPRVFLQGRNCRFRNMHDIS